MHTRILRVVAHVAVLVARAFEYRVALRHRRVLCTRLEISIPSCIERQSVCFISVLCAYDESSRLAPLTV